MERNDGDPIDLPVADEAPEREAPLGEERAGSEVEVPTDGVERERPEAAVEDAGVESPPPGADRARLLP